MLQGFAMTASAINTRNSSLHILSQRLGVVLAHVCTAIACVIAVPHGMAADETAPKPAQSAFDKTRSSRDDLLVPLQKKGEIRVIIGLPAPQNAKDLGQSSHDAVAHDQQVASGQTRLLQRMQQHSPTQVRRFRSHAFVAMTVDAAALDALLADPEVISISEDRLLRPTLYDTPGITRANLAWTEGFRGAGQVVAIIDTGVDKAHPFLAGKVVSEACYSNPGTGETSVCPGGVTQSVLSGSGVPCAYAGCDHGTHVAGIAAGLTGVLGPAVGGMAPDAGIIAIQAFVRSCSNGVAGSGPTTAILASPWNASTPCARATTSPRST